jgi:hypothetical protein
LNLSVLGNLGNEMTSLYFLVGHCGEHSPHLPTLEHSQIPFDRNRQNYRNAWTFSDAKPDASFLHLLATYDALTMANPANLFYEQDATLEALAGKTIVFIGYGNQGRAQALNLRDSINAAQPPISPEPAILIANLKDSFQAKATEDGFDNTSDWADASSRADVLFLLIPDQAQPKLFNGKLAPMLKNGCTIVVASGYNVFYKKLNVPKDSNVVMVAPRMIGTSVRSRYQSGAGFPCFVSVEQVGEMPWIQTKEEHSTNYGRRMAQAKHGKLH